MKTNLSKKQTISIAVIVAIGALLGGLILGMEKSKPAGDAHEHGHAHEEKHADHLDEKDGDKHGHKDEHGHDGHDDRHDKESAKGPHGGRMLEEDDFGVEVLLTEEGGEPRFRVYLFKEDKPLPSNAAKVSITLTRPDGEKQEISFIPEKDYLKSKEIVAEPHVFEATVAAQTSKEPYLFTFAEQEGKIELADAQVKAAGVTVQTAGAAKLNSAVTLPGEVHFNEDRTAHVVPRLAGVVEKVHANLGQKVKKGQVLAVIASTGLSEQRSESLAAQKRLSLAKTTYEREKKLWQDKISAEQDYLQARQAMQEAEIAVRNAQQKLRALGANTGTSGSLTSYEVRAPFDGTVVEKHLSLGEAVKEDADIFTISDLSTVWAEVAVPAKDLNVVRVGEKVTVKATAFDAKATGTIAYVGSLLGEQTRTAKARVVLANPQMAWRPGLFVNVEIVSSEADVPVAVSTEAVHNVNDKPTIFVRVPGGFLPQQIALGRTDGKLVEVVKGVKPGSQYAAAGSFVIKSELGKASAEHTH
ncbi:efflux RND transporter periplasmic adaptor subunit [Herbaspirillum sp. ST 5-3]|uniref:efflux RND transporter periplasmic adaptor subunit n=1 Tax=Oxalobacteraceae TaxID=75682 RepID=UPI0010A2EA8A|nr:efflux RND transporter periplasmic adaptor subunit [Herbaspirillum sp. ST 5-3]